MPLGILLLVAMLLLLVDLFDRRLIADPLAAAVEEQTGRTLRMGEFDLRWGWPLALHAEDVRFANADWGSDAPLLRVAAVSVSIDPLALLSGPPYADVSLRDPQLLIERSQEGKWNWLIDTPATEPEEPPRLPVRIAAAGGRVIYETSASPAIELHRFSLVPAEGAEGAQELVLELRAARGAMPLAVDGTFAAGRQRWTGKVTARAGESGLTSRFAIDAAADPLRLRAAIESELLVPAPLAGLLPAREAPGETPPPAVPRLEGIDAEVDIAVATLRLPELDLEDIRGQASVNNGRAQSGFALRLGAARLEGRLAIDTSAREPAILLAAALARTPLSALPEALPLSTQPGEVAAQLEGRLELPGRRLPLTPAAFLARLAVPEGRFLYAMNAGQAEAALVADLRIRDPGGEPAVRLGLEGMDVPPFSAALSAPPLRELAERTRYPVQLAIRTEGADARAEAQLGNIIRERSLNLAFSISGSELPALPAFGFTPPPVLEFSLSGSLQQETGRWAVPDFELSYGATELAGSAAYDLEGVRPRLTLDVEGPLLDLTAIPPRAAEEAAEEAAEAVPAWISEDLAHALRSMDARVEISVERVRATDEYSLEAVSLAALLDRGSLRADPVAFRIAGGELRGSLSADALQSPLAGRLSLDVKNLDVGRLGPLPTPLEEHPGRVSGELHLAFAEAQPGQRAKDVVLPTLGRLSLAGTHLRYQSTDTKADLTLAVARESSSVPNAEQALAMQVTGQYLGYPVRLEFRGDPLLALRDPDSPYELRAQARFGGVGMGLDGRVVKAWAPESARFRFSGSAEDPAPLEAFALSLPPFDVEGEFGYAPGRVALENFAARFAASDVRGDAFLDLSAEKPAVTASLHSNRLNANDLTTSDDEPGETGDTAEGETEDRYLLSRRPFDFAVLRRVNAEIDYTAGDLNVANLPLGSVAAKVRLQDGRLTAGPVSVETTTGTSSLRVDMQTRESFLEGFVEIEASGLGLSEMLADIDIAADSFGTVDGQAKFWLRGDSLATALGSLDGGLMLLMTGGQLDALLVEVAGLDIGEAALAAAGLYDPARVDCAYAGIYTTDGMLDIDRFIIDTQDTTFFLEGEIDLGRETLDLALFPEAKDPSFPASNSPLTFGGTLKEPEVGLLSGELTARTLGAAVLAALTGPLAALLPFVEPGVQDEPDECKGWVEKLEREHEDDS